MNCSVIAYYFEALLWNRKLIMQFLTLLLFSVLGYTITIAKNQALGITYGFTVYI